MTFEEARAQFPVFERYAYLNAGTNGPLARGTVEAMADFNRRDLERGAAARRTSRRYSPCGSAPVRRLPASSRSLRSTSRS